MKNILIGTILVFLTGCTYTSPNTGYTYKWPATAKNTDSSKKKIKVKKNKKDLFSQVGHIVALAFKNSIIKAAQNNDIKLLKELILKNPNKINITDANGDTALIWASYKGNIDIVKVLLDNGANPNITNNAGNTALHLAAMYYNSTISKNLIKKHANINIQNNEGSTPLIFAICFPKLAQILLNNNANINLTSISGSALTIAENKYKNNISISCRKDNLERTIKILRNNKAGMIDNQVHAYAKNNFNTLRRFPSFILVSPRHYKIRSIQFIENFGGMVSDKYNEHISAQYRFVLSEKTVPYKQGSSFLDSLVVPIHEKRNTYIIQIKIIDLDTHKVILGSVTEGIIYNNSRDYVRKNIAFQKALHSIRKNL